MCTFHMEQVEMCLLLSGRGHKHALRWAREYLDKNKGKREVALDQLRAHVEEADAAVRISTIPFKKYDHESAISRDLSLLREHGDLFPTTLKYEVLEWYCETVFNQADTRGLLKLVCPWRLASDASGIFDPTAPRLALIEGTPKDRGDYFRKKLLAFWCQGIRGGEAAAAFARASTSDVVDFLAKHDVPMADDGTEDEAFDDSIDTVLTAAKALQVAEVLGKTTFCKDHLAKLQMLETVLAALDTRGKKSLDNYFLLLAREMVSDTSCFSKQAKAFIEHKQDIKTLMPSMCEVLRNIPSVAEMPAAEAVDKVLVPAIRDLYVRVSTTLPGMFCDHFEGSLGDTVERCAKALVEKRCESKKATEETDQLEAAAMRLLKAAEEVLPRPVTVWRELRERLTSVKAAGAIYDAEKRFEGTLDGALPQGGSVMNDKACAAITAAYFHLTSVSRTPAMFLESIADKVLVMMKHWLETLDFRATGAGGDLYIFAHEILAMLQGIGGVADLRAQLDQLQKAHTLAQRKLAFDELPGDSISAKAKCDNQLSAIKAWRGAHIAAAETKMTFGKFLPAAVQVSTARLGEVAKHFLQASLAEIKESLDVCKKRCEDAKWPMTAEEATCEWQKFKKVAAAGWYGYNDGDQLAAEGEVLTRALQKHTDLKHLFGLCESDGGEAILKDAKSATIEIGALVWSVRAYTKLLDDTMIGTRLSRWAKRCVSGLTREPQDMYVDAIPLALRLRVEASVTAGPGDSADTLAA